MKFMMIIPSIFLSAIIIINGADGAQRMLNEPHRLSTKENSLRLGSCGDWPGETLWNAEILTTENYEKWERNREKLKMMTIAPMATVAATVVPTVGNVTMTTVEARTDGPTTVVTDGTTTGPTVAGTANYSATIATVPDSTTPPVTTPPVLFEKYTYETAVFVSQRHILTSSGFLMHKKDSTWHYNLDGKMVDISKCEKNGSLLLENRDLKVIDLRNQTRKIEQIALINFCELHTETDHILTLITVSKAFIPVPVICMAKWNTKIDIGDEVVWYTKTQKQPGIEIEACSKSPDFYCSTIKSCEPSIMVKREKGIIDFIVGMSTANYDSCANKQYKHEFHNIKMHIDEICRLFGFCGRNTTSAYLGSKVDKELENVDDDYLNIIPEPDFVDLYKTARNWMEKDWMLILGLVSWSFF